MLTISKKKKIKRLNMVKQLCLPNQSLNIRKKNNKSEKEKK